MLGPGPGPGPSPGPSPGVVGVDVELRAVTGREAKW